MKNPQKKVLWLPKWYPNKYDILDGVFTVEHAKAAAVHCDVFVLFVHSELNQKKRINEIYSFTNNYHELLVYFRHKKVGIKALDQFLIGTKYVLTQFRAYRKIKKIWGSPEATHIHTLARSSALSLWLKWIMKIPYFVTEHWSGFDPKTNNKIGWAKRLFIKIVLNNATCTTTVSNYLLKHVQRYAPNANYCVLSNTADENVFKPLTIAKSTKKKIIHVSTLDDYPKNFGNILRAIAEVSKVEVNFALYVFGTGAEKEKQEQLAKDLGVYNKFVFFKGYRDKQTLAQEIAESDFMILFSQQETQSCVIIEALLCGIPVIVPALGGVQELVNKQNGVAVAPMNNDEFSKAILLFIREKLEFVSHEIRANALQYGYDNIGEKFAEIYSKYT